jgi:hypothetical protein
VNIEDVVNQYVEAVDGGELTLDEAARELEKEVDWMTYVAARAAIDAKAQLEGNQ